MKKLFLLFILAFVCMQINAQTQKHISGLVVNKIYLPMANYEVTVIDSSNGPNSKAAKYTYTTNSDGKFNDTIELQGETGTLWYIVADSCGFATMQLSYGLNTPFKMATAGVRLCNVNAISTSLSSRIVSNYRISGFPIPFIDEFFVEVFDNDANDFTFNLLDINGRITTVNSSIINNKIRIDMNNVSPGIYFLLLSSKGEFVSTLKLVK
ncbi:MAG: T9SS type A sorting domain-containing protein [Bacteroidia bacterium]|nr:T9SS type A sorting domain-containing protein [Bacteroidia bacterium]